ncbi:MAG: TetR/AcrR family transcriptional regulator [Fusicatenibacter sp.]|nr:TetR/AcrR family transcriptional regulator [Lachnospiraceae bacterium]MDY2939203.1 TetR/AcrR family transcriptional regulator [Fusicatenibacter sp.]
MKKSEKTEITVSKILEAAMTEFGKNGYAFGTINNICKSGINKGLIYHNFDGKDALYLTCLNRSCEKLLQYIEEQNGTDTLEGYTAARLNFFQDYPNEAHLFFEALLNPPAHLSKEILQALSKFNELNDRIYSRTLDTLVLREGVTRKDAVSYFHLMQLMLNGYLGSSSFQDTSLEKKATMHELILPKLFDYMLYGIAKGEK